jgi:perosamine synthetase
MVKLRSNLYCGPLGIEPRNVLGGKCVDNLYSWFDKANVYYVHTARTAIRKACELLNVKNGDEILAPAYNCGSEIDVLLKCGASVRLYDVDLTGCIDLPNLYHLVSEKTKVIYITHYFGFPQPAEAVKKLCQEKNIYLVEDCALALFSSDGTVKLGSVGDISVWNFPKFLPVPDGGVLQINNPNLNRAEWSLRQPARKRVAEEILPLLKRYILRSSSRTPPIYALLRPLLHKSWRHPVNPARYGFTKPDIPAYYYYDDYLTDKALSNFSRKMTQKLSVADIVNRRRANFRHYLTLLSGVENVKPLFEQLPPGINPLYFPILVKYRQWVCDELNELSIAAIAWWAGYHRQLPWQAYPNARFLKDNVLALPVHQQLRQEHIQYICDNVIKLTQENIGDGHDGPDNEQEQGMSGNKYTWNKSCRTANGGRG